MRQGVLRREPKPVRAVWKKAGSLSKPTPGTRCGRFSGSPRSSIEAARSGIGPVQDFVDGGAARGVGFQRADFGEAFAEPVGIGDGAVDQIEVGAAAGVDGGIARHAELHADALEQRFAEFEDARAKRGAGAGDRVDGERGFRRGDGGQRIAGAGSGEALHGAALARGFVGQAGAQIGVVIGAVEGLLEAPVQFLLRRRAAFHVLKLRQRHVHGGVRQQRTAPVALQREQALGEAVRHIGADEVAAVIAQHLGDVDLRIPAERAPDGLVDIVVAAFGIGEEAGVGEGLQHAEDLRVVERARVDAFALLGLRVGDVPIVHGELGVDEWVMSG